MGIEKIIPKLADLALFLPMLATAGTGQQITCYNSLIGGPRQPEETDGPEEFHLILLKITGRSCWPMPSSGTRSTAFVAALV